MSLFYGSEEKKMNAYKANLKKEAANQFRQGEKLQEYLLYEKGIESQERSMESFAKAIGEQVGKNVNIVGKVDKLSQLGPKTRADPSTIYTQDESGVLIKNLSKNRPKGTKQPPKPKGIRSIDPNIGLERIFEENYQNLFGFEKLSDTQEQKLRQNIMTVLDEKADKSKKINDLNQYRILNNLMDIFEKQRLPEAFQLISENKELMDDKFTKKLIKNTLNVIDIPKQISKEEQYIPGTAATSVMSDAPQLKDLHAKRGPKSDPLKLAKERFLRLQTLQNQDKLDKKEKNRLSTLKSQLFRKPMTQEDIDSKFIEDANKAATIIQKRMAELRKRKALIRNKK